MPSTVALKAGSSTVRAGSWTVTRAVVGNWLAKRCSRSRCTARDWEPGTSNPPEPSRSWSPEAKLAITASSTTQAPMTNHRRLTVKVPSRPSRLFMSPPLPAETDRLVLLVDPMWCCRWRHGGSGGLADGREPQVAEVVGPPAQVGAAGQDLGDGLEADEGLDRHLGRD